MIDRPAAVAAVLAWYAASSRSLPWRAAGTTPWGVMVSEFMLQQTPVPRVEPMWVAWLERWPTATALADAEQGEAVRAWGRLGYPRRAQRLHAAAQEIRDRHGGEVPADLDELRALPGVGEYTAAAVASFGHGRRHVVLDTNVRRVLARLDGGRALPPPTVTVAERRRAESWLPDDPGTAAAWAAASMELGALVCTAVARPACGRCPVADACAWRRAGYPPTDGPARSPQSYAGTDRQCRGALLAVLRDADRPVIEERLLAAWPVDRAQAERALASLEADRLVRREPAGIAL